MRTTISKSWRFDAAHQLPNHDGKCAQPHGHTYTVTVGLEGEPMPLTGHPAEGMVADFATLDRVWRDVEPLLDHQDLNDTVGGKVGRTTSELLAAWLYRHFAACLDTAIGNEPGVRVAWLRVSETPSTYAEVRP